MSRSDITYTLTLILAPLFDRPRIFVVSQLSSLVIQLVSRTTRLGLYANIFDRVE